MKATDIAKALEELAEKVRACPPTKASSPCFSVGDLVRARDDYYCVRRDLIGVVRDIKSHAFPSHGVEWAGMRSGHDLDGAAHCKTAGYWVDPDLLVPA